MGRTPETLRARVGARAQDSRRGYVPRSAGWMRDRLFPIAWAAPLAIWQGAFYVAPFLFMIALTFWTVKSFQLDPSFSTENWTQILTTRYFWSAYGRSLLGAGIAAVAASVIAFPCSYLLATKVSRSARIVGACLLITPFFSSYLVRIQTWRAMLGNNGVVNAALEQVGVGPLTMIDNLFGTVVGYLTLVFPLVLVLQLLSLSFVDRRLIEAAHNLGCGPFRVIFAVVIPAARIGLLLGGAFAFVLSFGDFVSPDVLGGGNPPALSLLIVDEIRGGFNWPRASVIAVIMVATLLAVVSSTLALAYRTGGGRK